MSVQQYDTMDVVLDDSLEAPCVATKATSRFIWRCDSTFHGDQKHYYVRAI